jgi:hypothetical protein
MTPVAVRIYVRRTSDLAHIHRTCIVSSFAGYVAGPTGKWGKRLQGRPGHLTGTSVSPSSLRQGPKSSTGSARMPLAVVTSLNTGSLTVLGSLDRGRYPSYGTATRRSFGSLGSLLSSYTLDRFEKEAEVALIPQERPARTLSALSVSLVKRNRGTDFSLSALWARQSRFCL